MPSPTNTSNTTAQSNKPLYANLPVPQTTSVPTEERNLFWEGTKGVGTALGVTAGVAGAGALVWKSGKWVVGKAENLYKSVGGKIKGMGRAGKVVGGVIVTASAIGGGYNTYNAHSSNQKIEETNQQLDTETAQLKREIAVNLTTDEYKAALQYAKNISPNLLERQALDELIKDPSQLYAKKATEKNLRTSEGNTEKEKEANLYRYEKAFRERVISDYKGRSQQLRRAPGIAQHTETQDQDLINTNSSASNALAQSAQPIKETTSTEENLNMPSHSNSGKGMA